MIDAATRQRFLLAAFWGAIVFTFVCAEIPAESLPQFNIWDKLQHFGAFFVLASIGALAYPRRRLAIVGAGLAAFGVLIELVQALPFIHRDAEVLDVVADVIGIVSALLALRLFGLPKYRRATEPGR